MRFRPLVPFRSSPHSRSGHDLFATFKTEMDDLFDRFFEPRTSAQAGLLAGFAPSIDVSETDTEIIIKADLPGIEEDGVHLELHEDVLTLRGERNEEKEAGEGEDRRIIERSYGRFERSMRLPFAPNEDDIDTNYQKGVLKVTVQKPAEAERATKRIPIKGKWV